MLKLCAVVKARTDVEYEMLGVFPPDCHFKMRRFGQGEFCKLKLAVKIDVGDNSFGLGGDMRFMCRGEDDLG